MSITPRDPADFTPERGNYTELKPFRFWCQKVLPLVYDNSLSYYELLCKVVDFLNKTMEDVETLEDDVTNLHTAYVELQAYVNEYFSSLDVQAEIDNKLDEMASDGSLTALIIPLLPDLISAWLSEHITPTTPIIDNTLTIQGAGADAKVVGTDFTRAKNITGYLVNDELTLGDIKDNGRFVFSSSQVITDAPANFKPTELIVNNISTVSDHRFCIQIITGYNESKQNIIMYRMADTTGTFSNDWNLLHGSLYAINNSDIDNYTKNGSWILPQSYTLNNRPFATTCILTVYTTPEMYTVQIAVDVARGATVIRRKTSGSGSWTAWVNTIDDTLTKSGYAADANAVGTDFVRAKSITPYLSGTNITLSDITDNGVYRIGSAYTITDKPAGFTPTILIVTRVMPNSTAYCMQFITSDGEGGRNFQCIRFANSSGQFTQGWMYLHGSPYIDNNSDLNDAVKTGSFVVPSTYVTANKATNNTSLLEVFGSTSNFVVQKWTDLSTDNLDTYFRRRLTSSTWSEWTQIANGNTYNYNNTTYENTYNVTATPTLEVNSEYFLASTNDDTDRTAEIVSLLNSNGLCRLGKGRFVVSNLVMPVNTMLQGCGYGSIVELNSAVTDGFCIQMKNYCIVKDLHLVGGDTSYKTVSNMGTRHGIVYKGVMSGSVPTGVPRVSNLSNVFAEYFSGCAFLLEYTGTSEQAALCISDVWAQNNHCGICVGTRSEYNHITGGQFFQNYYGVICKGGNNYFANCKMTRNFLGIYMDNTDNEGYNNSHGCFSCCSINHNGASNDGYAIWMKNMKNGMVFEGCNIFYGKIHIEDSDGVVLSNFNVGSCYIFELVNDIGVLFANWMLRESPSSITKTGSTCINFVNCYNRTTGEQVTG